MVAAMRMMSWGYFWIPMMVPFCPLVAAQLASMLFRWYLWMVHGCGYYAFSAYGGAWLSSLWVSGLDEVFNLFLIEVCCGGVVFRIHNGKRLEPTQLSMVEVPFGDAAMNHIDAKRRYGWKLHIWADLLSLLLFGNAISMDGAILLVFGVMWHQFGTRKLHFACFALKF